MGNREDLLAAARQCLYEQGFARTTARDIAAASGVSLAAIGYHFGSKEALMNAAMLEATAAWSDELNQALAAAGDPAADPSERFEATWNRVIASFAAHRQLWAASFEIFAHLERFPEVRAQLAAVMREARLGLAELFQGLDPADDERRALAVGAFYHALLSGVLVQWMIDPDQAPTAKELAGALRDIAAQLDPTEGDG